MEPSCGQSIVKCEKQKDDGRMETQKRKQNEKEKAERRMKIVAGLGSVDEYIPYVQAGADELFCGYVPYNWTKKYGTVLPLNRREVLAYNVQLGSFSELEILSAMIRKYRKPVHIAMNSLYYIPEQYEEIADIVKQCMKIGFDSFILADPALILYLRQKGIGDCYRESCYQCAYANMSRVGDLTVGDFWGIAKSHPSFNSPKGVSSVFVNTEKGQKLFEMMRVLAEVEEATLEEGMVKQHNLVQPSNRPVTRDTFSHTNNQSHSIIKRKFAMVLTHKIMPRSIGEEPMGICHIRDNKIQFFFYI